MSEAKAVIRVWVALLAAGGVLFLVIGRLLA